MIRFIKLDSDLFFAVCEFCEKQHADNGDPNFPEYDILSMLTSAYDELDKINGVLPVTEIYRYHISCEYSDYILSKREEDNGIIFKNAVHLGTFITGNFDEDDFADHDVTCGYEIIYDLDDKKIKLLYRIEITTDEGSTLYRVEDDTYESFDAGDFIVSLSVQLAEKLRNGGNYLRKVCECPCV